MFLFILLRHTIHKVKSQNEPDKYFFKNHTSDTQHEYIAHNERTLV